MTDFAAARRHMVDGQVRTADVTDHRIIFAMLEVPRERFVPPDATALAYLDLAHPVGGGRCLLKPVVLARLIQAADLATADRVLVVGCATGYSAAVIAHIAGEVVALEQDAALAASAEAALASQPNATVVMGPLVDGWPQNAPYDAIFVDGAVELVPDAFRKQLQDGGRLVCVLGGRPQPSAMLYRRSGEELGGRAIFDAAAAALPGFAKTPAFAF
ncbi:MAG: protein-L-isoaspartate O-methyltransferase [Pseudolabrys sp.]|nr:protein-L-isoaspartate O-methyltransferase [Pseudolabrys sp.]MDP2294249.1 protein-L-isoaspartate O-methyltransferase [Pseudolabrys sp.]